MKPGTGQGGSSSGGSSGGGSGGTVTPVEESLVKESGILGHLDMLSMYPSLLKMDILQRKTGRLQSTAPMRISCADAGYGLRLCSEVGTDLAEPAKSTVTSGDRTQNVIRSDNKDPQTPEAAATPVQIILNSRRRIRMGLLSYQL